MKGGRSHAFADSEITSRVIEATSDIALLLDGRGVIVDLSLGESIPANEGWSALIGKRWSETVAKDSQNKVEQLLKDARTTTRGIPRAREINQRAEGVGEVPVRFNAVSLDDRQKRVVALGRDLRPVAALQQQIITSQQALDAEYGRMRQADTRYRVLFHVSAEGALVADATSRRILEANPAAATLLGEPAQALVGKTLTDVFDTDSRSALQGMLAALEAGTRPADVRLHLRGEKASGQVVMASASLFRQASSAVVLLRFWLASSNTAMNERTHRMMAAVEAIPDGFVVTKEDRTILCANNAFCELVQQANENQVIGQSLDRWLGRPGVDVNIMLASLREHGSIRNFATIVRGDFGEPQEAVVTAVAAFDGKVPCIGFTIRRVSSRLMTTAAPTSSVLPRSIEQLRELVGRVTLKELVRESADLIERLCIEAALDVSGNNRASAAQLLGLSRQGLYLKLRRYGIQEFESE